MASLRHKSPYGKDAGIRALLGFTRPKKRPKRGDFPTFKDVYGNRGEGSRKCGHEDCTMLIPTDMLVCKYHAGYRRNKRPIFTKGNTR